MRRTGKALAVLLTLTGATALVGASAAAPPPAGPGIQNPSNPQLLPKAPILRAVPVDAGAPSDAGPSRIVGDAAVRLVPGALAEAGAGAPAPTSAPVVLTPAQKAAVLTQLNDLRASIGAASMQTLAWDDNLARFAGTVAGPATVGTPCVFAHSSSASRMNVPGWVGTYVGETIAAGTSGITSLADATNPAKIQASLAASITSWWSEKPDYDYATNTCAPGKVCGRYTQLAWASTKSVGCAVAICTPHPTFNKAGYSVACNFGAGGNFTGQKPY